MVTIQLDLRSRRELLADWVMRLGGEAGFEFNQYGGGPTNFSIGSPTAFHVTAIAVDEPPFLRFTARDASSQHEIDRIVVAAAEKVEGGEFGNGVWYSTQLAELPWSLDSASAMGKLLLRLGMQRRILGWRRLGGSILLEFAETPDEAEEQGGPPLLARQASVKVHLFVPGPVAGHFTSRVVHGALEVVGAACTFALGRPVRLPHVVFPTADEKQQGLESRRGDRAVLTLARKGTSLDIFSYVGVPGGFQVFERARAALITYDAAVQQERDTVASILYVVAAECLTVPNTQWRRAKLTTRFARFFDELMPQELDTIVQHRNFEEAFGIPRGNRGARKLRRELLDQVYDFRSGQLHEGLASSYRGFALGDDMSHEVRRGLLADFAEGAILKYLAAPRCSIVGHPGFDPST